MKSFRKTAALILAFAFILASAAMVYADFDKTTLADGIFQLNVVHSVEIPALEEDSYTVWTSAVCFAAGRDANGQLYLMTDAGLADSERMFSTLSRQFTDLLAAGGIDAAPSELPELVRIAETTYYLVYEGSLVELSLISQTVSKHILLFKPVSDVEAPVFSYGYADTYDVRDTVHCFSLSGTETDGIVPATEDAYITNWSFTTQQGEITVPATVEDGNISCTMTDLPMRRASQGSALFDDAGNVIGLGLWSNNTDQFMALTSSALMAILDQAGISYTVTENESRSFSLIEAALYLGIAVVVIIILVVILIVLHSRRKKLEEEDLSQLELEASRARAEYARQQHSAAQNAARPGQGVSQHTVVRPASDPLPPVRQANAAAQYSSVMLTILSGDMKGYSVNIADKVTLGRDPEACNVVFPPDAASISRRHCAVSFNKNTGRVLLEDLNSSNGTYFPSGTRIIPGRLYALRSGDRFYLGAAENLVEVRMQ